MSVEERHNEDMSPEEKLLQVIQADPDSADEASVSAKVSPPVPVSEETPVQDSTTAPEPTAKPPLKVKTKGGARKVKDGGSVPANATAGGQKKSKKATASPVGSEAPALWVSKGAESGGGLGIQVTNRILAVAAVLLVGLAVWEIYGAIQEGAESRTDEGLDPEDGPRSIPKLQTIRTSENILSDLEEKSMFQSLVPVERTRRPVVGPRPDRGVLSGSGDPLDVLLRESLSWKAQVNTPSGLKVLVADKKHAAMHVLKEGDTIDVAGQLVVLEKIERDRLIFSSGKTKIHLKPSG